MASVLSAFANIPGGGTGTGANVTLTDNGGTVTIANGIVSILCTKSGATINQINYTFNNSGSSQTLNLLSGGNNGGQLYWENSSSQALTFTYALVANTANNGGNYAEIALTTTSVANDILEVHFSMLRGATGFYVTAIWYHRSIDGAFGMGECRDNIYSGSIFNWMSVDATRNRLMSVAASASAVGVDGAPAEVSLWTNGIYAGQYEDKYKYSADFGTERVWGWSSVGTGGKNIGLWNVLASAEYYNGGPLKRDLMSQSGTTVLNMLNGGHYGGGTDGSFAAGEVWTKVTGPYFIYCNNITNTITATNAAAQALYNDALAQAAAEATAWPYSWFTNANYSPAASRGAVSGQIVISDSFNPNASASNLWVGLVQQPVTTTGTYDFQKWMKPYQFWVKTDANGNFTIPNVIAGNNYTLYAFGPGAAGTFQSQAQSGGSAPNSVDIPVLSFSVTVTAGATNNLGAVTWTPTRVGPTVFEIGYPDRTAAKFRHGEDWWVGDLGPNAANPSPIWSKWLEYPFDFPSGPNYTVGQSRWTTDWNFCQPVVTDSAGNYNGSTSTITFNLASAPGATASLYLALASDYQGPLIIKVNGTDIAGSTGYFPAYNSSSGGSDSTIREAIHGVYSDNRITFSGSLLHTGQNTVTINMRKGGYFANHAMYDYLRLELVGYVPPPPSGVTAYAGNNCNLVCWPVTPGATSYNIFRTTTSGNNYVSVTNGVTGPICGSGWNNATYLDRTAANGTTYYYVVQSVNPVGASTNSPQSSGATPGAGFSTSAPAAPTGLAVASAAHQSVTLNWSASAGANFYTVYRSTLFNNGGGASNTLNTIVLNNATTAGIYTDASPTDGSTYSYCVTATGAGGTSGNSAAAIAVPLPPPPASAPGSLAQNAAQTNGVTLSWSSVSGAVGYLLRRSTSVNGPFVYVTSITETAYLDNNGLNSGTTYYYQLSAMNAGGVSGNVTNSAVTLPGTPANLTAVPGDSQIVLTWPATTGATSYILKRGTSSGNETTTVISGYTGTSYTNTALANGTTYYYLVAATDAGGTGPNSSEASATPSANIVITAHNLVWKGDGAANLWNISGAANWLSNTTTTPFNNGDAATFDNIGSNNVAVALTGTLLPVLTTFNASKNYTFGGSGSIAGTNILVKAGTGTLTITSTNTYSGGTILSNGIVALSGPAPGGVTANNFALGSGAITFNSGILQLYGYNLKDDNFALGYGSFTNDVIVFAGQIATFYGGPRYTFGSKVTGSGTLNFNVDYVRGDIGGDWTGFAGALNIRSTSGTPNSGTVDDFRVTSTAGFPNARLALGTNVFMYSRATAGSTIPIGEFSAGAGSFVSAGGGSSAGTQFAVTWRVGGLNTDATNAAIFQGSTALIKEGRGAWVLTGASTHTGATTVSNGTLVVNGSFNGSPLTIAGGTLGGVGVISGAPVTMNPGTTLAPGCPFGMLTISNNLTLPADGTAYLQVRHAPTTNSAVKISGTLFANGTLIVTNIGKSDLTNGDSFKLFSTPNLSGGFTNIILPDLADGLLWNTNALTTSGTISVVALTSPTIASAQIAGVNLILSGMGGVNSWPYLVLASTNLTTAPWTPVATNQFDVAGGFTLTITNAVDPGRSQTFFRLQLQ